MPSNILATLMVNVSREFSLKSHSLFQLSLFHSDSGTEAKHALCVLGKYLINFIELANETVLGSAYKCDKGQTNIRGKCISRADRKMNFSDVCQYEEKKGNIN